MTSANAPWHAANLVALGLEGSGAQDRGDEQILEIAAIRLVDGEPDMATAYTTLLDPGRAIPAKPWISPGLSGLALQGQPTLTEVRGGLLARLTGTYLVGHNIGADWRLLHRHVPELTVTGLVDTHRLAKAVHLTGKLGLTDLLSHYQLSGVVTTAAPDSRPHRALWDTTGAALLLSSLIRPALHCRSDPCAAAQRRRHPHSTGCHNTGGESATPGAAGNVVRLGLRSPRRPGMKGASGMTATRLEEPS